MLNVSSKEFVQLQSAAELEISLKVTEMFHHSNVSDIVAEQ